MAKAAMMVALSGSVALVVTVEDHKTMAEGGAQTRPPTTQCCTHKYMPKHKYTDTQIHKYKEEPRPDPYHTMLHCYTHICGKNTKTQKHKYTNTQIHKYSNLREDPEQVQWCTHTCIMVHTTHFKLILRGLCQIMVVQRFAQVKEQNIKLINA